MENSINIYVGEKPYIFFSYSHKDKEKILRIINRMSSDGYRCWYDQGIPLTQNYIQEILSRIQNSSTFIACISNEYLKSDFCKREIWHALDHNVPILPLFLEECTVPDSIEIGYLESIYKFRYINENDFYMSLYDAPLLSSCKEVNPEDADLLKKITDEAVFRYYQKRAEQGEDTEAQCMLGYYYYNGKGTSQDYEKAFHWFRKAAKQGESESLTELGKYYFFGIHPCFEDKKKGIEYWQQASNLGNARAMTALGKCYYFGDGIEIDGVKAIKLYRKAANLGFYEAQNLLAHCYLEGNIVCKNPKKAAELYHKSEMQGSCDARHNLAHMFYFGIGVDKDEKKAIELLQKNAELGYTLSKESLEKINQ